MEAQRAGAERMATKEKSHETKKPFRKKSLKSVGNFMQRILRTLSSLSHLGQDGERGPRDAEDDDGGFKQKGSAHEDFRLVQGGDSNNNLGKNQVASRGPDRLSWNSEEKVPGVQGLKNHGNTCFMNAVVQCLSNTDLLAEFLGMEQYREDLDWAKINGVVMAKGQTNDTPMSDRGEVTERLACLVRGLWTFQYTPQLSVEFKNVVSQYGAQFRGNSQHDALEFLLWLLDRVHEDLNAAPGLALKSPSKPPPNIDPSATNLSTSPQTIKEHSFVQEHFQAQYRSSLTCPHCHKQSDTFDPFLCVSLPIPLRQTRAMNITLVFQSNQKRFLRVGLAVPLLGTVAALRQMVADEGKMPPDQVVLAELYPTGFQRSFSNEDDLNSIAEGDPVYAFQAPLPLPKAGVTTRTSGYPQSLPASPRCSEAEGQRLPGSSSLSSEHLASSSKILLLLCNLDGSGQQAERFGPPLLVREERTLSWEQLQQCIVGKIRYLMKSDAHPQNGATFFHIRVAGGPVTGSYLSPKDPRPLQHPAVDRALQTSGTGGPPHVKLSVEWEPKTKERLFGSIREEVVQDAESVRSQQMDHQQQSCTLNECFHLYTKEEQLAPDDAWRCPYCKVLQQGTVKLSLWTLPDILIIHLKRFRQVGGRRNKLSTLVRFPLSGLDMAPHVVKRGQPSKGMLGQWSSWKQSPCPAESGHLDVLYDLYAVCNHHGSLQGGHYTAYCRNSLDARWYNYDDSSVELVPEDEVCTRGAYILFYQKRNAIPAWSASSSVRGSTSSSMSDHWALRLSGSKRESLVSRATSNCTPLPRLPDSPVFLDKETHPDKGCIGSKSFSRGVKGRSASMKVSSVSKLKLNISKAVPLRWSFGSKDRSKPVTGELVEYLESGRRPKFTNDSIVPLMAEKSQPKSINPKAQGANVTGRSSDHSQGEATVSTAGGQAKQSGSFSKTETPRSNPKDNKNLPDSTSRGGQRKVEGTTQPKHRPSVESPSGICSSPADGFLKDKPSSSKKPDHNQRSHHKDVDNTRTRPSEAEGQHDAKLTKSRSSFAKKEAKKQSGSESFNITELPNGAPRTTLSNGVLGDGRTSGTMPHRHKEDLTNGKSQVDIRRAQSSSNVQNKAEWTMKRSASLYKNGSVSQQPPRQMSAERVSSGTLQRLKYQTSSLGRKKTVPESSF